MISNKAQQILDRVRKKLLRPKNQNNTTEVSDKSKGLNSTVNQDKTDPLFPNSADAGPEAQLPITGPDQGMLSTRLR